MNSLLRRITKNLQHLDIKNRMPFVHRYSYEIVLGILCVVFISIGIFHLDKFHTPDEDLWFANPTTGRIHDYWQALKYFEWENTRINDKPGITTALIAGPLGFIVDKDPSLKFAQEGVIVETFIPENFQKAAIAYRLPILLTNALLILFIAWFVKIYTESRVVAFLTAAFLYLSPILLGMSQIVNPDSTLWSFGFAGIMAFVVFLKTQKLRYAALAGPLLGLAILSKYTGSFLLFFSYLATFSYILFLGKHYANHFDFAQQTLKRMGGFLLLLALALITFVVFLPATWSNPEFIYEGTIAFAGAEDIDTILWIMGVFFVAVFLDTFAFNGRISYFLIQKFQWTKKILVILVATIITSATLFTLFNWGFNNYFEIQTAPFDAARESSFRDLDRYHRLTLQFKPLAFTLPPVVLGLGIIALIWTAGASSRHFSSMRRRDELMLLIFLLGAYIIFFYYAASVQRVLVHVRYSILLYPIASFLAALGGYYVYWELRQRGKKILASSIILLFLILSALSLAADKPFYFNYTNDLLPKDQDVVGAWGYGGYEAAQYIKEHARYARYTTIWADYAGVCQFFPGPCVEANMIKWYNRGTYKTIEYFVVTRRGLIKNESVWEEIREKGIVEENPVWELYIGDRPGNFIKIYKATDPWGYGL